MRSVRYILPGPSQAVKPQTFGPYSYQPFGLAMA